MTQQNNKEPELRDEIRKLRQRISELETAPGAPKQDGSALHKAEERFGKLVEQSLMGVYIYQDGYFPYINPKASEILGYSRHEAAGIPLTTIVAEEDHSMANENIRLLMEESVSAITTRIRARRKDGEVVELEAQGSKTEYDGRPAIMGTFLDITERKKMEAEFQKVQKLESLSSFASGIANEYNNILTVIIGNLALAKMYAKPGYEVYDVMIEAEKASLRAKDITAQLLSFAKGGILVRKVIFMQELLRDLLSLSSETAGVTSELAIPDDVWPLEADEAQIGQAINTLVANARQASLPGSSIRISAENVTIRQPSVLPLKEGRYVVVSIHDHGNGLAEQDLQTLFDPFRPGDEQGNSLGLASSFAIIQKHEGHITAESRFGEGTTFRVFLPALQEKSQIITGVSEALSARKGRILVMDDEEIVRVVVNRLLLQCGFEAELAKDGAEMLRLYREAKEKGIPFSAVILDLVIQEGMGGQEAMENLLEYDPDARVIVSSGYSSDPLMANFRRHGFSGFLPKPYKLDELKRVLKEVVYGPR